MSKASNSADERTCFLMGSGTGNCHFEGRCEDCDVWRLSRLTLGDVEDRYHTGRVSQDQYEAYGLVWEGMSPTRGSWRYVAGSTSNVRRIARKLLRARGFEIPTALKEGE